MDKLPVGKFKVSYEIELNARKTEITRLTMVYRHGLLWIVRESLKMEKGKNDPFPHITEITKRPNNNKVLLEALDALCKERRAERYYYSLQSYFTIFQRELE